MNLLDSRNRIIQLMSTFVYEINSEASMGKTDRNKAAETMLIPLLNEVYGWSLENVNCSEDNNNYPGIDLGDQREGIAVQVTATPDLEKIKHTLKQFIKYDQYLKYPRIIIYILKEKQDSYSQITIQKIVQNRFKFDPKADVWDYRNIIKEVSSFQIDRTLRVQEILEANLGENRHAPNLLIAGSKQEIDWREICQESLDKWKELTTDVLTKPNGVHFQLDKIFVPLGVVERRQKARHRSDGGSPEHGSELYEEKVTPISQDDFFEQVLRQGQSKSSQGSRIAIIGEPGAGKTTQLQKVGDWILKETGDIPIWISLAVVGTKTLREYLLNDWLQTATQELEIPQQYRDELGQLLKTGRVWLLLDGVDEMAIADALHQIATQMREGWLKNVRVVLTCRLNVWDAGKNALLDLFDVYRNLDFDYPSEVHEFIDKWFATESELQQKLKSALEQPGKERIRDMVKNPLRLTLLCYSWQLRQGELPETKAGLYEWFVDAFYEWNKGKVPVKLSSTKRKELNLTLGELAKEAIDQESSRFRLREKFVNQFLGDADHEDYLFYLALQLGWLNRVGIAEENPLENVYAFFHPTFQEYFAALAINDWHYFFNHVPNDPSKGTYRIFESQWKEVFLLWLGREDIPQKDKEGFLSALVEFDDTCNGLYQYQTYCLAAAGISEFVKCSIANSILKQVIYWHFGYFSFNLDNKKWLLFLNNSSVDTLVTQTLRETNGDALIESLIDLTTKYSNNSICRNAARSLGEFGSNSNKAIQALSYLMQNSLDKQVRQQSIESLGNISGKSLEVLNILNCHIFSSQDKEEQLEAAKVLGKLDPGNLNSIEILVGALLDSEDSFDSQQIGWALRDIDINNESIHNIENFLATNQDERERQFINEKITYINPSNSEADNHSREILGTNCDEITKLRAAQSLIKINSQDLDATSALISLLQDAQDIEIKKKIIVSLGMSSSDSSDAVDTLSNLLHPGQDVDILILASEMIRHIGFRNKKAILALTQLIQASQDSELQYHYINCLSDIDPSNLEAISSLIKLLKARDDNESNLYAINIVSGIGLDSQILKDEFLNLLNSSQNQRVRLEVAWNLWLYSACNLDIVYTLLSDQLFYSKNEETCHLAAWRLKSVLQGDLFRETAFQLAEILPTTACEKDLNFHKIYFDLALFCAQKMSYLDFYRAWHDRLSL